MKKTILYLLLIAFFFSCQNGTEKEAADLILFNGVIYTVNEDQPLVEAIAIKDDKILALGKNAEMEQYVGENTEKRDLQGNFTMPGFIEGHGHFSGLGSSLMNLNFLKSKSWKDIVAQVAEAAEKAEPGEWIVGRGWHQEKWMEKLDRQVHGYPYHDELSEVSPDNPVFLRHASGHGSFANAKAMELAGINKETPNPSGGEIVRDSRGEVVGMFEERAQEIIGAVYQDYLNTLSQEDLLARWHKGIELAEAECLQKGITSFQDAGSSFEEIERYQQLAKEGKLDLRLWAMVRHSYDRMKGNLDDFPIIGMGNNFFTVRAIKTEVDGALGAFGAWLLKSYDDKPDFVGQNTTPISEVERIGELAMKHDLQLCVHAIGDKANQVVLNIIDSIEQKHPKVKDARWRIEHAQHLAVEDIPRFKELGVIAAMQAVHCTSDAPFVVKRLGEERARKGAYAWRALTDAGAVVTNGTDAPVEDVSAIESFYATVTRKRADNDLEFFTEQALTRAEAIQSYTLNCAYSAFEEDIKGSLEKGKLADIVVLSKNLLSCSDREILETKILMTMVGGKVKFEQEI